MKKHSGSGVQCALLDASNPDAIGGNYVLSDKSAQAIKVTCEIYPAFKAPLPVIQATPFYKDQLVVIPNPRIVPVFYQDSPAQAARVDFLRKLIASPLWLGLLEYGVGAATLEPAVVIQAKAPQLLTTSQAIDLFRRNASSWVNPNDPNTFFILYLPDTTQIDGMACGGGYHHTSNYPNIGNVAGPKIAFAVVSGCGRPDLTAEHEIMEGAADPYGSGYFHLGVDNALWWGVNRNFTANEVGDMCEQYSYFPTGILREYEIQPIWSNVAAKTRKNPCATDDSEVFFGAVPELPELGTFAGIGTNHTVVIGPGQTRTIPVRIFSNTALNGSISIKVLSNSYYATGNVSGDLTFKLDRSQAKNGDTFNLSITAPPGLFQGIWLFKTVATFQGKEFTFPGAVVPLSWATVIRSNPPVTRSVMTECRIA